MSLRRCSLFWSLALMMILGSGSLAGQEEVIAFGDSITQGASWQDE